MKRFTLWFAVALVFFSFSGGFAEEEMIPADLAALDSFPDVLKHDNYDSYTNPAGKTLKGSTNYWIGVRFLLPIDSGFTIGGVELKVNNELINIADTAHIYLTRNKIVAGVPRPDFDNVLEIDTIVAPFNRLQGIPFHSQHEFGIGEEFWIVLGPIPGGPDTDSAGQGWWAFSDAQTADTNFNFVSFGDSVSWQRVKSPLDMGNFVIRARGTYSPLDVVINEVMFNADSSSPNFAVNHEWVELYNRGGIQTLDITWRLYNDKNESVRLTSGDFNNNYYMVVHINAPGHTTDTDSINGNRIDAYRTFPGEFFSDRQGGCAVVKGSSALSVVSWNLRNLGKNENLPTDTTLVPSFNNWENSFFGAKHLPLDLFRVGRLQPLGGLGPLLTATPGISIGRNSSSSDSAFYVGPQGKAFTFMGGPNSAGPTMGRQNQLPMVFDVSSQLPAPTDSAEWTLMLYIAGDYGNDSLRSPDRWYFDNLNQIERANSGGVNSVNVAVLYDTRRARLQSGPGTVSGTFEGGLKSDGTDTVRNLRFTSSSVNTGQAATLANFLAEAMDSFPARHYVLALKGDGAGWEGLCGDGTSGDRLEVGELDSALQAGLGSTKLDLLILDAPLMSQLEVAAQVQAYAHRMVASPEMIGPADFDYPRLVKAFKEGTYDTSAVNTLKTVLKNRMGKDPFAVWTITSLDNLDTLLTLVNSLAVNLRVGVEDRCARADATDNFQLKIRSQLTSQYVDHYGLQAQGMADFVDLKKLAKQINTIVTPTCDSTLTQNSRSAGGAVLTLLRSTTTQVIEGTEGGGVTTLNGYHRAGGEGAGGLSIYFPSARRQPEPFIAKNFPTYSSLSDHPFDNTGLETEGGVSQGRRIYALDAATCSTCTGGPVLNQPFPAASDVKFVQNYNWDEFLIRYYKPVADVDTNFFATKLGQPFTLDAGGTSDADTDPGSLIYFWDLSALSDSGYPCDSVERQDMDKNCINDNTDDGDVKGGSSINLANGLYAPGDNILWLYVWDDNHLNSTPPRFQTSKSRDSLVVQIDFKGYQLAVEDDNVLGHYTNALDSIKPFIQDRQIINLYDQIGSRTNMASNELTEDADKKPYVIWTTGNESSTTFPANCRTALNNALANDSQGVWISGPKIGNDPEAKAYFVSLFKDTINANSQPVDTLFPDTTYGRHFLSDFGPIPLLPGTSLQSIVDTSSKKCPTFPLLVTKSGQVAAIAKVIVPRARGAMFSTFGLEHIANIADKNRFMRLVLDWLTVPRAPDSCPDCQYAKGDMNGNGVITSADAVLMSNCAFLGTGNCGLCFADVNCDGSLTNSDAVLETNVAFLGVKGPTWCGP